MSQTTSTLTFPVSLLTLALFGQALFGQAPAPTQPITDTCCATKPFYAKRGINNFALPAGQIAVATMWAKPTTSPLKDQDVVIWNISAPYATPGTDWAAAGDAYYSDPRWNYTNLGDVSGMTIDDLGNIYVAATTIYGAAPNNPGPGRTGILANPQWFDKSGDHGQVYKIANGTGDPTPFAQLPNKHGAGLGDITFDCLRKSFYVANFDDGLIYQLNTAGKGTGKFGVYQTWDHGANLNLLGQADILGSDAHGYAKLGRRPWAVRVHAGRLYYSIWNMDSQHISASPNQVWSIGLDAYGGFIPPARLEVSMPLLPAPAFWSNPVSDLAFTPSGDMIAAERTMWDDNASSYHFSRVLEFAPAGLSWNPSSNNYVLGCTGAASKNSAGSVDFDRTPNLPFPYYQVWATGDYLHFSNPPYTDYVSGLQGFPSGGGNGFNSLLIDLDLHSVQANDAETLLGIVRIPCKVAGPGALPPDPGSAM